MSKLKNSIYVPPIIEHLPCVLWTYYHFYLAHFPCLNKINNLFYYNITARFQCGILHHNIIIYHMFTAQSRASSQSRGRIRTQSRCSSPWAAPAPPSCSQGPPAQSCTPATQKRVLVSCREYILPPHLRCLHLRDNVWHGDALVQADVLAAHPHHLHRPVHAHLHILQIL